MQNLEHAKILFEMCKQDFNALKGMVDDNENFSDEIFGFHAQQAVEKAAKALMDFYSIEYRKIHDLYEIFSLLKLNDHPLPENFSELQSLTDFGVDFRYEPIEDDIQINRHMILTQVSELVAYIASVLSEESN